MIQINQKHLVHTVLGHSYMLYVVSFCVSIYIDYISHLSYNKAWLTPFGMILLIGGSFLILWSQQSGHKSGNLRHQGDRTTDAFSHGPYAFMHAPTQIGLLLMTIGVSFVFDFVWIGIFGLLTYFVSQLFFVRKQVKILHKRYGPVYKEYRRKARL